MTTSDATRVAIVEDDPRYRHGIEVLLRHSPGFSLDGSFGNARACLAHLDETRSDACPWDIVLMDLELPGMTGVDATAQLKARHPDMAIVVLTAFEEPATILGAICAGADAYLLKKTSARDLLRHLEVVRRGGSSLSGEIAKSVLDVVRRYGSSESEDAAPHPSRLALSDREQDVLRCLTRGLSYAKCADELGVKLDTVRDHIRRIYRKLQVHSAAEAVSRAVREGLI